MELVSDTAIQQWRDLIGPTNTQIAKSEAPDSLRALFGTDNTKNAVHGSDSKGSMQKEIDFWFGGEALSRPMKSTAILNNCTLCIIKPHIVSSG